MTRDAQRIANEISRNATISKSGFCFFLQSGQQRVGKPGVSTQPNIISWTWVRQRHDSRPILAPCAHRFGQVSTLGLKMPTLCEQADDQYQLNLRQRVKELLPPGRRAFRARWKIAGLARAWIAKPHWQYRYFCRVVKYFARYAHPIAKPVAASIIERYTAFVNTPARGLSGDQNVRILMNLNHGPWPQWQRGFADSALPYLVNERFKPSGHFFSLFCLTIKWCERSGSVTALKLVGIRWVSLNLLNTISEICPVLPQYWPHFDQYCAICRDRTIPGEKSENRLTRRIAAARPRRSEAPVARTCGQI